MHQTMSGALGRNRFDKRDEELERWDEELERLRGLVRDLKFEARGRPRRKDHEERGEGSVSVGGHYGAGSHQSESHQHWDRTWEYANWDSISLVERQPQNATMDAIGYALRQAV